MNPDVKAKWLAELRSGKFAQTRNKLKKPDGFCCLGVLCDIYAREHQLEWTLDDGLTEYYQIYDEVDALPEQVFKWAGLPDDNPEVSIPLPESWRDEDAPEDATTTITLAELNDNLAWDFNQIADVIERKF
jgi:hypothetical protein